MVHQQRFHPGDRIAAHYRHQAIAMRKERFAGWARTAAVAIRDVTSRSVGLAATLRALFRGEHRR